MNILLYTAGVIDAVFTVL